MVRESAEVDGAVSDSSSDEARARARTDTDFSATSNKEWVYDDETVQRDRDEAAFRAEKTHNLWETTCTNSSKIRKHLAQLQEDGGTIDFSSYMPASPSEREDSASWMETHRRLAYVGGAMSRSQERFTNHAKRQTQLDNRYCESVGKLVSDLKASDDRTLQMQRNMVAAQQRRAFNNAQKRCEQQKVLREQQKEKERIWEAFYTERQKSRGSQAPVSETGGSPKSPSGSRGSSKSAGGTPDILRTVHQSHGKYMVQLDQWRQFVAENERRTDVQWKKVLQGGKKEDYIPEPEENKKNKALLQSVFKKTLHQVQAGRGFKKAMCRLSSKDGASDGGTSHEQIEAPTEDVSLTKSARDGSPSTPCSGRTRMASDLSNKWKERREQVLDFNFDLEQATKEQGTRDEERLAEARERIRHHNKSIQERCKEQARQWQERCDAASERRRNVTEADTEEYDRKYAACLQRMKDEADKRKARAKAEGEEFSKKVVKCKETSRSIEKAFIESTQAELTKLDAAMLERESIKRMEADARRVRNNFQERVEEGRERKADALKATLKKHRKELIMKRSRSELQLTNLHMSVLDRERERLKGRKAGMAATTGSVEQPSNDYGVVLPKLSGTMSLPILLRPVDASPIRPPPRRNREEDGEEEEEESEDDESDNGTCGLSGKAAFLKQLENSCGIWLTDLRKNIRMAPV